MSALPPKADILRGDPLSGTPLRNGTDLSGLALLAGATQVATHLR